MRLVTFVGTRGGEQRVGAQAGETVTDLAAAGAAAGLSAGEVRQFRSVKSLLGAGQAGHDAAQRVLRFAAGRADPAWTASAGDVTLRAPIPHPGKILLLAGNYMEHRQEGDEPVETAPLPEVFIKPRTAVIGPDEAIRLPGPICTTVDYEGELGVVIGRSARNVASADALSYVGGYVNFNDVSGRELNPDVDREPDDRSGFFEWLIGKWFDTFAAFGPAIVTSDEIADPEALTLATRVNGEQRQQVSTGDMIFSIRRTIEWISKFTTLEPGDIIATGTPAGVGAASGTYLQAGDVVEVEVTGLGVLRNPVADPVS